MVRYYKDTTGRFDTRPHYKPEELDSECEEIINSFLRELYGEVRFPVVTDDLTKLIERDARDLDIYADLSSYGPDVEGVTEFHAGDKPSVEISARLTEDGRRENRFRTTLTHEYGHVRFHAYLFEMSRAQCPLGFEKEGKNKIICKRDTIEQASQSDWMEWQAGYICGSILMPVSAVRGLVGDYVQERQIYGDISATSEDGFALVSAVSERFKVSQDAAKIRLLKLGHLTTGPVSEELFRVK